MKIVRTLPNMAPILAARMLDIILPPQKLLEGGLSDGQGGIDGELWGQIRFLDNPCCDACGYPFEFDAGIDPLCGNCTIRHPAYDKARAAFVYDHVSRKLVLSFKHGGRTEGLDMFVTHMRRAGRQFWDDADMLIPVPLHPTRLIKRRYNQAALLARALSKQTGVPFNPDLLFRTRATPSQGEQTGKGRFRNVRGAFEVPRQVKHKIQNAHVVLIDDVMTTGATLESCARTLKRAGAAYINVVTLARTVRERTGPNGDDYAQS